MARRTLILLGIVGVALICAMFTPDAQHWLRSNLHIYLYPLGDNAPIELSGRVLDQNGNGIPDVRIFGDVHVKDGLYSGHVTHIETATAVDGSFYVSGYVGTQLVIKVQKPGYIISPDTGLIFDYAGNLPIKVRHTNDPTHPTIITLWKAGTKEELVSQAHEWSLVPDGRIYTIDLIAGHIVEGKVNGDLYVAISRAKDRRLNVPYEWSFHLEVIGGGIVPATDAFLFLAPESGYENTFTIMESPSTSKWTAHAKAGFYLKCHNGMSYTAIQAEIDPSYTDKTSALRLRYWINPSGSRNLEH